MDQKPHVQDLSQHSERRQVSWPRNLQLHDLDEKSWYRPTNSIYAAPWYGILNRFRKFYNSPNSESEFFAEFEKRYFLVQFYFLPYQNHHIHRNRICSLEFCIRHLAQNRHTEFQLAIFICSKKWMGTLTIWFSGLQLHIISTVTWVPNFSTSTWNVLNTLLKAMPGGA